MDEMKKSKSYKAGLLLGNCHNLLIARSNLLRRIMSGCFQAASPTSKGLIEFANFINEKLAIHDGAYPSLKEASVSSPQLLTEISDRELSSELLCFRFF